MHKDSDHAIALRWQACFSRLGCIRVVLTLRLCRCSVGQKNSNGDRARGAWRIFSVFAPNICKVDLLYFRAATSISVAFLVFLAFVTDGFMLLSYFPNAAWAVSRCSRTAQSLSETLHRRRSMDVKPAQAAEFCVLCCVPRSVSWESERVFNGYRASRQLENSHDLELMIV